MDTRINDPGNDRTWRLDAAPAIDLGLRSFMLRVFNTMAGGLALTGAVAYGAASSGLYASIAGALATESLVFPSADNAYRAAITIGAVPT